MNASISVVMGTHNGSEHIEAQLLSIFNQTLLPDEIVISDDCSDDKTVELISTIRDRATKDNPTLSNINFVLITNTTRKGVNQNYELVLSRSSGSLIALCDQDDIWEPSKLSMLASFFKANPHLELIHSDASLIDTHGELLSQTMFQALLITRNEKKLIRQGSAVEVLLQRNIISGTTIMFRRNILSQILPIPVTWYPDEWIGIVAAITGDVVMLDQQLVRYRQHGSNTVGAPRRTNLLQKSRHWIRHSRTPDFQKKLRRLAAVESLVTRGEQTVAGIHALKTVEFVRARSKFPHSRIQRFSVVIWNAIQGNYRKFGAGFQDVICDLIQPG